MARGIVQCRAKLVMSTDSLDIQQLAMLGKGSRLNGSSGQWRKTT